MRITMPLIQLILIYFKIRYSDDVAGNKIDVYLDNIKKGSFITDKFGDWESFEWDDESIDLGKITSGYHTVKLKIAEDGGGTWGVNLDVFKIYSQEIYDQKSKVLMDLTDENGGCLIKNTKL